MLDPQTTSNPTEPRRVLITGASGVVGRAVAAALVGSGHRVRGLDIAAMPDLPDAVVGDIADRETVDRAMAGIDTVIHLAAYPNPADFIQTLLWPNVVGLYNVVASAVAHRVRRIVLASTMQVISGHRHPPEQMIGPEVRAPTNDYALTKLWAEDLGEMTARVHGIEVIAVRIGFLPRTPQQAQKFIEHPGLRETYLSHADAGRFFLCAVESALPEAEVPFHVVYLLGPSASKSPRFDRESARRVVGFEPRDHFPGGLPFEIG